MTKADPADDPGPDIELIANAARLQRLYDEVWSPGEKGAEKITELDAAIEGVYAEIVNAPVHTPQGVAAKLRAMQLELDSYEWGEREDTALATMMAALERMETPDPVPELVRKYVEVREWYGDPKTTPDDETDTVDREILVSAEEALMAATPTTREGVIALLDIAASEIEQEVWAGKLIENAVKAIKAGAA